MLAYEKIIINDELIDKNILIQRLLRGITSIKPSGIQKEKFQKDNNSRLVLNKELSDKAREGRRVKTHAIPVIDEGISRIKMINAAECAKEYILFTAYELGQKINLTKLTDEILRGLKVNVNSIDEYARQKIYLEILGFDFKNKRLLELVEKVVDYIR